MLVFSLTSTVSCTSEWQDAAEVEVNFTAALPAEARSRSFGDGTGVDCLYVGLYDENQNHLFTQSYPVSNLEVNFQLSLAKNKKFHLIFWAYNSRGNVYQWDDLTSIRMVRNSYASWEETEWADAFYGIKKNFVVTESSRNQYISLSRPLAQVNVGTTGQVVPVSFSLHSLPNTFHPLDGTVSGENTEYSWTFDGTSTETFKVDKVSYHYLAVGYVFAPVGTPMETALTLTNMETANTVEFPMVKLQANRRCNIAGNVNL